MSDANEFDIIVIGKGLIGSAAARYLSETDFRIAVIGIDEPQDFTNHHGVFASHYDEGRITRVLDQDKVWAELAKCSIQAYGQLEQSSGIQFHHAVGCVNVGLWGEDTRSAKTVAVGDALSVDYKHVSAEKAHDIMPMLRFPEGRDVLFEYGQAGYINPRALIVAQLKIAEKQNLTIIRDTVLKLSDKGEWLELDTERGKHHRARKVLVAAGAYSNFLLDDALDVMLKPRTILLGRLSQKEAARLSKMPSVIFYEGLEQSELSGVYALPPIRYPDGQTYIKIGGRLKNLEPLRTEAELLQWFHSEGDTFEVKLLRESLFAMIPNLEVETFTTKPCVITATSHGRPYIDAVIKDKLFVAAGGNGAAAKSSNEIGRLAAELVLKGAFEGVEHFSV